MAPTNPSRRSVLLLGLGTVGGCQTTAHGLAAPNVVPIDARLVTSGQPTRDALSGLARQGYQAVVYLAPRTVPDAIEDEPELLSRQGIEFVHVPIPFGDPDESHLRALTAALQRLQAHKVLVHCQVNMRASSMVFLHRVIHRQEDPALAYESVARVWSPSGPWRRFIVLQLRRHGIDFEPY